MSKSKRFIMLLGLTVILGFATFNANAVPQATITGPQSGAVSHVGDTLHITWTADTTVHQVLIYVTFDTGQTWLVITPNRDWYYKADNLSTWGTFDWIIPDSLSDQFGNPYSSVSDRCKIRMDDSYVTPALEIYSNGFFTILPAAAIEKSAVKTAPSAGIHFNAATLTVTATSALQTVSLVDINGRSVFSIQGNALKSLALPASALQQRAAGRYIVRARTVDGKSAAIPWVFLK